MSKEQIATILALLKEHYPHAHMILTWNNNVELLISIILSAQCTDVMVNKVTTQVFPKYKTPRKEFQRHYVEAKKHITLPEDEIIEVVNFAHVSLAELEQDIKSTGFYKNKAKNVRGAAQSIIERYQGILPRTIAELITIPGCGRKTANVFLGNAYHIQEGIAVDTHVAKQSQLLGFTRQTTPEKIEQDLMSSIDQHDWFQTTYLLIEHGRNMRRKMTDRYIPHKEGCPICQTLLIR